MSIQEQIEFDKDITRVLSEEQAQEYFNSIQVDATSTTEVEILSELKGKFLTKIAICYIASFNPDRLKIVTGNSETMEGKEGCITVYLNNKKRIEKVTFGITLKLPEHDFDNIDCDGYTMECLLQGWNYR